MANEKNRLASIYEELSRLHIHDHGCLIYDDPEEWQAYIAAFIQIGLERHEKCIYAFDAHTHKQILNTLQKQGIDTASAEASGQLILFHGSKVFLKQGFFTTQNLIKYLIKETEKAIQEGFQGLRATGERSWVSEELPGSEKFLEYEALLNRDLLPYYPCLMVCQYDTQHFSSETIKKVLQTHPYLVRQNNVYGNSFYLAPEFFLNQQNVESDISHWFKNIETEDTLTRELRENIQNIRFLLEKTPAPAWIMDENWNCIDVNHAALKFLEATREELSGKSLRDFIISKPEGPDLANESLHHSSSGIEIEFNINDQSKTLIINIIPFTHEHHKIFYVTGLDITKRVRSEKSLQESEDFSSGMLDNLPNPILVTNSDASIHYANPALQQITGYTKQEIIGRKPPYPWWPQDNQGGYLQAARSMQAKDTDEQERSFQKKNGELFWVSFNTRNIFENGEHKYCVANWTDITARKQAEEELEALYSTTKAQSEVLQQEADARGMFIEVLAHELRTPLTPVMVSSEILREMLNKHTDARELRLIANIIAGAKTLSDRLEDLLKLGQFSRGIIKPQVQSVSINSLVHEIVTQLREQIGKRNQILQLDLSEKIQPMELDPDGLKQVLQVLILAASRFSPIGSSIYLKTEILPEVLKIEVKDSGKPVTQEEQERLFQPYHLTESDRQKFPGLGLGLAVARQIIEAHGGKLELTSHLSKGNTFHITLPVRNIDQP